MSEMRQHIQVIDLSVGLASNRLDTALEKVALLHRPTTHSQSTAVKLDDCWKYRIAQCPMNQQCIAIIGSIKSETIDALPRAYCQRDLYLISATDQHAILRSLRSSETEMRNQKPNKFYTNSPRTGLF